MIGFLLKCLPLVAPAIRYADNPNRSLWRLDLLLFALLVFVLDVAIAHLFFAPRKGEWTISHTLERTAPSGSRKHWLLAMAINNISPNHIKSI